MAENKINTEAIDTILTNYITQKGLRKTQERFFILHEIYQHDGHFEVEELYVKMKNQNYSISRATLYNTIDLLLECKLVSKHQFGKNHAVYERSHKYKQHDHLICLDCQHVLEFCDPRIQSIKNTMSEILNFTITNHSLHLYGNCKVLAEKGECIHHTTK